MITVLIACLILIIVNVGDSFILRGKKSPMRLKSSNTDIPQEEPKDVGVVLLAGGKGTRMKAAMPKQFLPVLGKAVFLRSLDVFLSMGDMVSDISIVLDESFRDEYAFLVEDHPKIRWANPGKERQDSVFNGLCTIPDSCSIVAIHDSARPLVTVDEVTRCLKDGIEIGAAVLGVPMKATVKESRDGKFVDRTVPRSTLWEIHTPQVATKALFLKGFERIKSENLEITDDVSVIEALGEPVKLTLGEYTNIKLTTPDDLSVAEQIFKERGVVSEPSHVNKVKKRKLGGRGETAGACTSKDYMDSLEKPAPAMTAQTAPATPASPPTEVAPTADPKRLLPVKLNEHVETLLKIQRYEEKKKESAKKTEGEGERKSFYF